MKEHMENATILSGVGRVVVARYVQDLSELTSLVCELVGHWETYLDQIYQRIESTAYYSPIIHNPGRRGRPSFDISRHQL